ncbi:MULTISPECIES: hypothetical protein [unclassified Rathayibacter]|uniref:hypothetical protein n=1 Tax=unclassified Rathayibacter TaxID=2609250 RepID=UPI000CE85D78|nr:MULTISPECIES: hypothetical protein [unclassified Rathayibacter]PPG01351.1 hypothetical protein C5C26_16255 [Rathayibacter sp. AY2B1]PPG69388.1 hypothetical protein C5C59_11410 [Rathayibacter sp. AY1F4]
MHRSPLALTALLVGVVLAAAPAADASTVSAAPAAATGPAWSIGPTADDSGAVRANFDYALDAGAVVEDSISVRNDGAAELVLDLYSADAFTTREGGIDVLTAGTASEDSGTWISLDSASLSLAPGQEAAVPFTVTVPADALPGDHPAGIVTSLRVDDPDAQVQVDRRLGTRLQLRVAGDLVPTVELSEPRVAFSGSWNPLAVGFVTVDYSVANTGNTRITGQTSTSVSGPFGVAAASAQRQLPEVLPGSEIDVQERLDGVGALLRLSGAVSLQPSSVGFGAAAMEAVTAEFGLAAVPVAALLILLGAAALVALAVALGRRRARASSRG